MLSESGQVYRICIGEFVLAQMLFAVKRLGMLWDNHRAHGWTGQTHGELFGRTVGIIGLGPIGLGVAQRARGFGMRVVGCRRTGQPIEDVREVVPPERLDWLLGQSDFVVLACPLTAATRGLIGREALARMKPSAWLFNIARGAIVLQASFILEFLRMLGRQERLGVGLAKDRGQAHQLMALGGNPVQPHLGTFCSRPWRRSRRSR